MDPVALPSASAAPAPSGNPGPAMPVAGALPVAAAPGGAVTLATLFAAEESALLRFAIGLTGRRAVAEDLVQETFLRLHQVWDQVENPRGWLYRSLRNLALNHLRDHARETPLDESAPVAAPAEFAPDALGRMEAVGVVRLLVAELPEDDRRLLRFKYHDNLKYREISQRTGLTVGNVGYRLHHLLKSLADTLRRSGIEGGTP